MREPGAHLEPSTLKRLIIKLWNYLTLPVLGAHQGWPGAMKELGRAVANTMRTGGNMARTLRDPEEIRAFKVLEARGDIDRTQSHTLAAWPGAICCTRARCGPV